MKTATDFIDEDTNPEALAPMHPEVIEYIERLTKAARHYKMPAEAVRDFDRLLALARGER